MGLLYDLARMTTLTTGNGASLVLDSAVPTFLSFDDAGVPDGGGVSYAIVDGLHRETGRGLYTTSSKTLTRAVESSTAAGARITLSGSAVVFITALDKDFREWNDNHDANGYSLLMDTGTGIKDDSGNSQLLFTKTASAVNYITLRNAATTGAPQIAAAGSDTDINLELVGKGAGGVLATFTNLGLHILDNNATHDLIIAAAENLTADRTLSLILGDADRSLTLGANSSISGAAVVIGTENQGPVTGGVEITSKSLGTQSSGTLTVDLPDRSLQHYTNNGAHTLDVSSLTGSAVVDVTNGASAGAITFGAGITIVYGQPLLTTVNGDDFRLVFVKGNAGTSVTVLPLQ